MPHPVTFPLRATSLELCAPLPTLLRTLWATHSSPPVLGPSAAGIPEHVAAQWAPSVPFVPHRAGAFMIANDPVRLRRTKSFLIMKTAARPPRLSTTLVPAALPASP